MPRYSNSSINQFALVGKRTMPALDRFVAQVVVVKSGCWIWQGGLTRRRDSGFGYGRLRVNGRKTLAHRFSFETFVRPIPKGRVLDHLCRVSTCVNPFHLVPVTQAVNSIIGVNPSSVSALTGLCKKGTHYLSYRLVNSNGKRILQGICKECLSGYWKERSAQRKAA